MARNLLKLRRKTMFQDSLTKKIAEAAAKIKTEPEVVNVNEKSVEGAVEKIMNEKLIGNQHKIDANKNNKIDSHDFKLLRAKKKVEEDVEELDESHFKVGDEVICKASGMEGEVVKVDPKEEGKYYTVKREDGKMMKYAPDELKKEEDMKEEAEQIDEAMWPGTPEYKAKYGTDKEKHEAKYGKSGEKIEKYGYRGKEAEHGETDWSKETKKEPKKKYGARQNFVRSRRISGKQLKDSFSGLLDTYREGGLKSLKEMFVKEEPDNEQFTKEVEEQKKRDRGEIRNDKGVAKPLQNASVRENPVNPVREEVEELDELSKSTLASYAKKATRDARMKMAAGKDFERHAITSRKPEYKAGAKSWEDKYKSDARRREAGVGKAIDRLAKEEVEELDEAMTRKHFQQVADVIKSHPDQEKRNELAKHHAGIFKASNPRFDHSRFYQAAGANIKEEVEELDELDQKTLSNYATRAKFSSDPKHREGAAKAQAKLQNKKDMKKEEVELEERSLTEPEMKKKEEIVKSMKKGMEGFKARYGDRAKQVAYATATKIAKEKA
jgi:preprotein translocase subunit YajC